MEKISALQNNYKNTMFFPVVYGIIHAVVDASCVMAAFNAELIYYNRFLNPFTAFYLVIMYDLLAFAGQPLFGFLADKLRISRSVVIGGISFTALGIIFLKVEPITAIVLAGLGNALFHVGAGALSLHVHAGRAAPPGIFVGPGVLGLALGTWVGTNGHMVIWPFLAVLGISLVIAVFSANPELPYRKKLPPLKVNKPFIIMLLLLFSVFIRAFVGFAGCYGIKGAFKAPELTVIMFFLAFAAFGGKTAGGIISDRMGWIKTSVIALLISAPLIVFGGRNPYLLGSGMLLFQMTMPVTLVAIAALLPGKPGFAFGLPCLALILGAYPAFIEEVQGFYYNNMMLGNLIIFVLIVSSAVSVYFALTLLKKAVQMKFGNEGDIDKITEKPVEDAAEPLGI